MSKETNSSFSANDHDYEHGMVCSLQTHDEDEFPPLPVTLNKPPLPIKPNLFHLHKDGAIGSDDAVLTLADLINSRSDTLDN